jgi:metallo-beta-lactamase family protein
MAGISYRGTEVRVDSIAVLGYGASQVNAVAFSRAHIDHSGNLPLLAKQGYRGPIYTTPGGVRYCMLLVRGIPMRTGRGGGT